MRKLHERISKKKKRAREATGVWRMRRSNSDQMLGLFVQILGSSILVGGMVWKLSHTALHIIASPKLPGLEPVGQPSASGPPPIVCRGGRPPYSPDIAQFPIREYDTMVTARFFHSEPTRTIRRREFLVVCLPEWTASWSFVAIPCRYGPPLWHDHRWVPS
jgi:hypothetical protein